MGKISEKIVILRFIQPGEAAKKATLTYLFPPKREFWHKIWDWVQGKQKIGRAEKILTINLIVSQRRLKREKRKGKTKKTERAS